MLDFKKNIYSREKSKLEHFANTKMATFEEKEQRLELPDDFNSGINTTDITSVLGSDDAFQLNGIDGDLGNDDLHSSGNLFGSDDLFGGGGGGSGDVEYDVSQDNRHRTGVWWKDFLLSPYYLIVYTTQKMIYDKPNRADFVSILRSLNTITTVTGLSSLFMWIIGLNFIFNLGFQAVASGIMFALSFSILKFVLKEEVSIPFFGKKVDEGGESESDEDEFDFSSGLDFDNDASGLSDGSGITLMDLNDSDFEFDESDPDDEDEYETDKSVKKLPQSPVLVDFEDDAIFDETLLELYKKNVKYQGVQLQGREAITQSMSGYFVSNTPEFSSWTSVKPRSKEGLNILYTLYKVLSQIQAGFGKDEEEIIVMGMKSNPLMYRIELELPTYFKNSMLQGAMNSFKNMLKRDEADLETDMQIVTAGGLFIFKITRYDSKPLISLGDLFRYQRDGEKSVYETFLEPRFGQPLVIGLYNSEFPLVIDFEENTCGTIVAGSGAGKSWFTFSLLLNWILAMNPDESQVIIMDKKSSPLWKAFAKSPHVLGHHTDITKYNDLLDELKDELARRKELLLNEGNEESYKGLREKLIKKGQQHRLKEFPLLTVVIDEITATMGDLETLYTDMNQIDLYKKFVTNLGSLSAEMRSFGMRIIVIGQRSITSSIPKSFMSNSSLKMAMRMENPSDLVQMFGDKEASKMNSIASKGVGYFKDLSGEAINLVKTTSIGGLNDSQMIALIRTIGFEWVRRSIGSDINYIERPIGFEHKLLYNRNKFVEESLEEMKTGRILNPSLPSSAVLDTSRKNDYVHQEEVVEDVPTDFGRPSKQSFDDFELEEDGLQDDYTSLDISSNTGNGMNSFESNLLDDLDDIDNKFDEKIDDLSIDSLYTASENDENDENAEYTPPSFKDSIKGLFGKKNKAVTPVAVDADEVIDNNTDFNSNVWEDDDSSDYSPFSNVSDDDSLLDTSLDTSLLDEIPISSNDFENNTTNTLEDIMGNYEEPVAHVAPVEEPVVYDDDDDDEEIDLFSSFLDTLEDEDVEEVEEEEIIEFSNNEVVESVSEDVIQNDTEEENTLNTEDSYTNFESIFDSLDIEAIQETVVNSPNKSIYDGIQDDDFTNDIVLANTNTISTFEEISDKPLDLNVYFQDIDIPEFESDINNKENDDIFGETDVKGDLDSIFEIDTEMYDMTEFANVFQFETGSIFDQEEESQSKQEADNFKQIAQQSLTESIPEDVEKLLDFDYLNILDNTSNIKVFEKTEEELDRERFIQETRKREEDRLAFEKEKAEYSKRMELEKERLKQKEIRIEEARIEAEKSIRLANESKQSSNISSSNKTNIKSYILKNGAKKGLKSKKMTCSEIDSIFSPQDIKHALDRAIIIKDNDFYIATID